MNIEIIYTQTFKIEAITKILNVQIRHGGFPAVFLKIQIFQSRCFYDVIKIFKPFLNSLAMETSQGRVFMLCKHVPVCNIIVQLEV